MQIHVKVSYREEFKKLLSIFLKEGVVIPEDLLTDWLGLNDEGKFVGSYHGELQLWVTDNLKNPENPCITGLGVLEAIEHMLNFARENGNVIW